MFFDEEAGQTLKPQESEYLILGLLGAAMQEKVVEIVEGATGRKVKAELLVCKLCKGEKWLCYVPEGMEHVHFQCVECGVSYCDGCAKEEGFPP